jgi:hypothetical protein
MTEAIDKTKAQSPKRKIVFRPEAKNSMMVEIGTAAAVAGK